MDVVPLNACSIFRAILVSYVDGCTEVIPKLGCQCRGSVYAVTNNCLTREIHSGKDTTYCHPASAFRRSQPSTEAFMTQSSTS